MSDRTREAAHATTCWHWSGWFSVDSVRTQVLLVRLSSLKTNLIEFFSCAKVRTDTKCECDLPEGQKVWFAKVCVRVKGACVFVVLDELPTPSPLATSNSSLIQSLSLSHAHGDYPFYIVNRSVHHQIRFRQALDALDIERLGLAALSLGYFDVPPGSSRPSAWEQPFAITRVLEVEAGLVRNKFNKFDYQARATYGLDTAKIFPPLQLTLEATAGERAGQPATLYVAVEFDGSKVVLVFSDFPIDAPVSPVGSASEEADVLETSALRRREQTIKQMKQSKEMVEVSIESLLRANAERDKSLTSTRAHG